MIQKSRIFTGALLYEWRYTEMFILVFWAPSCRLPS
jgi:hypothetical protein